MLRCRGDARRVGRHPLLEQHPQLRRDLGVPREDVLTARGILADVEKLVQGPVGQRFVGELPVAEADHAVLRLDDDIQILQLEADHAESLVRHLEQIGQAGIAKMRRR